MTLQTGMMLLAAKMPLDMMISKMSEGMVETLKIFFLTLLVFITAWFGYCIWQNGKKQNNKIYSNSVHSNNERNSINVAGNGNLFWT